MVLKRMFPCMLIACFVLSLLAVTASAQTADTRPTQAATINQANGVTRLETDPVIISRAEVVTEQKPNSTLLAPRPTVTFNHS